MPFVVPHKIVYHNRNKAALPSVPLVAKIKNAIESAKILIGSDAGLVSEETFKAREAICAACDFWNSEGNAGLGECRHPDCGCTKYKLKFRALRCPIGKWTEEPFI